MPFIPTEHGARIVINWTKGSETFSYVYYATKAGFDLTAQQQLADAVDAIHTAAFMQDYGPQVSYLNTTVYDARTLDGAIVSDNSNTRPGSAGTEIAPIALAVCVTLRTAGRGRSARGRKYITGYSENNTSSGEWTATAAAKALSYVQKVHDAIGAAGWQHVIRSIQENGVHLTEANTRAVTSFIVRGNKVATQRRRVDRP